MRNRRLSALGAGLVMVAASVTGPDGALWYTNFIGNSIGRITTSGHVKSAFHAPSIRRPSGIAAGPGQGAVVHQLRQ